MDVFDRAKRAEALLANEDFIAICNEICDDAAALFLQNANDTVTVERARTAVVTVQAFRGTLTATVANAAFELKKKERQHRGSD